MEIAAGITRPSGNATGPFNETVDHTEFLTKHGEMIAQPLRDQFPHVDLKVRRDCATLLAGTHRWPGGTVIKTIPGGDAYTGVALRIYPPDPTDPDALAGFVRIDELNVAKRERRKGVGKSILIAISQAQIPVYHSFDLSRGWWQHMHLTQGKLFNRRDLPS